MLKKIELKDIKNTRVRIDNLSSHYFEYNRFPLRDRKIIVDALVYLNYKLKQPKFPISNLLKNHRTHSIISALYDEANAKQFFNNLAFVETINIQNVINCYRKTFNLDNTIKLNIEEMLQQSDIEKHPLANLAIQLFLLRGNYNWEQYPMTDFMQLVSHNLENIPSNAVLNCWEAVLVALYRAKILDKNIIKDTYNYSNLSCVPIKLSRLFGANNFILFDKKLKPQFEKKACIICFNKLAHVMLSIPFSQKQILRMLITENFDEKPDKLKLYSLWNCWTNGKFDTVKKSDFKHDIVYKYFDTVTPVTLTHLNLR